jgi:hypothetical protein
VLCCKCGLSEVELCVTVYACVYLYVLLTQCNWCVTVAMAQALPDVVPDGLAAFCVRIGVPYVSGKYLIGCVSRCLVLR